MTAQDRNETAPDSPAAPRQAVWPTVLGVFALVSAAVNLASGVNRAVQMVSESGAAASQAATSQQTASPSLNASTSLTVGLLLSIWLLWAAIGLIRRRSWSGRSMLNWAAVAVIWLGIVFTMNTMKLFHLLQQEGPPEGWTFAGFATAAILVLIVGLLPSLVPPVFAVIWFSRRRIRNEMATWA